MEDLSSFSKIGKSLYNRVTGTEKEKVSKDTKKAKLPKKLEPEVDKTAIAAPAKDLIAQREEELKRTSSKRDLKEQKKVDQKKATEPPPEAIRTSTKMSKADKETKKEFLDKLKQFQKAELKYMQDQVAKLKEEPKTFDNLLKNGEYKKDIYFDFRGYKSWFTLLEFQLNKCSDEVKNDPDILERMAELKEPVKALEKHQSQTELHTQKLILDCAVLAKEVKKISESSPDPLTDTNYQQAYVRFKEVADKLLTMKKDYDDLVPYSKERRLDTQENYDDLKLIEGVIEKNKQLKKNMAKAAEEQKLTASRKVETEKALSEEGESKKVEEKPVKAKPPIPPESEKLAAMQRSFENKLAQCWKLHTTTVIKDTKSEKSAADLRILEENSPLIVELVQEMNKLADKVTMEPGHKDKFTRLNNQLYRYQKYIKT